MAQVKLSVADYLVVAGYFVLVLWIGLHFRNKLESAKDYFAGGRQVPWWLAGISHYMSSFSAFGFIAYAQIGYTHGWVAVTLFWSTIPACLAGGLWFAPRWRRARVITPVQFVENRFNGLLRQLFAWAGIPAKIFDDALKIFATSLFLTVSAGVDLYWSIFVCGAVMVAYTFLGGLWALIVTDYVQFLIKALAILLLLPFAVSGAGGFERAFRGLPEGFFGLSGGPFGWLYIAGYTLLVTISYNANWSLVQKYYSVPREKDAAKAAYCAGVLNLIGAPLVILPAMVGRNLLPDLISQNRTADTYVLLVLKSLPIGVIGIFIAAMLSATMAVVSADFNAIASVLTNDVYHRLVHPRATERQLVRVGRWITLALGALTTVMSLWIAATRQQSLFSTMVTVLGLFMIPTLLPLLAGLVVRGLTWQGALAGFVSGLATGLLILVLKTGGVAASSYDWEGISLLANTAASIVGMIAGTLLSRPNEEEKARIRRFFETLDEPIRQDEAPADRWNPSRPLLGVSTLALGALIAGAGLFSRSDRARWLDLLIGLILVLLGIWLHRRGKDQPRADPAPEPGEKAGDDLRARGPRATDRIDRCWW